ncbi:hypothetical protein F5Y17DRAFT_47899 [Xylariaceae sp. FL0594]|nr:hypothetical protein F5Y17DRAFT_47899 [Xylariaceae sp. FL0594]
MDYPPSKRPFWAWACLCSSPKVRALEQLLFPHHTEEFTGKLQLFLSDSTSPIAPVRPLAVPWLWRPQWPGTTLSNPCTGCNGCLVRPMF